MGRPKKYDRPQDAARAAERALAEAGGRRMHLLLTPEANSALAILMERRGIGASALICEMLVRARGKRGN